MRPWILPTLLGVTIVGLVASTRQRPRPASAAVPGPTPPGGGLPPTGGGLITESTAETPPPPPSPPPLTNGEVLASHRALMARVQNDIRSVDPVALQLASQLLGERGYPAQAAETLAWAGCVQGALSDPDYFPRACGPYPYAPGQSPIIIAKDPLTLRLEALRARHAAWVSADFYAHQVATQDRFETELRAAGLTAEADQLRARRNALFALRARNAVTTLRTAAAAALGAFAAIAAELQAAGYPAEARAVQSAVANRRRDHALETLRTAAAVDLPAFSGLVAELQAAGHWAEGAAVQNAIANRRRDLSQHECVYAGGCDVFRSPDRGSPTNARLPVRARVAMLSPGDPPVGPPRPGVQGAGPQDFAYVSFDAAPGAPTEGWILASVLQRV